MPRFRRPANQQRIAWLGGTVHSVALAAPDTDGRLTLLHSLMRAPAASPVHVHREDDETLLVLSGTMVVWCGAERWEMTAGDAAFLPRHIPHSYRVVEDTDVITICTPGGIEAFFAQAGWDLDQGDPPADWSVDRAELERAATLTDETVLGPPLEAEMDMPADFHTWTASDPS